MKEYDEEGVAYVGIEDSSRIRSQGGRSGGVLQQMRRVVSGNAQRVRSGEYQVWANQVRRHDGQRVSRGHIMTYCVDEIVTYGSRHVRNLRFG